MSNTRRQRLLVQAARRGLAIFRVSEIARRASVSVSAVHATINDQSNISRDTKQRVLKIIRGK